MVFIFLAYFTQGTKFLWQLFSLTCVCVCPTLCDPMDYSPPGSYVHGDSLGKNAGVGRHFLPQGIFPTQGLNMCLPRLRLCR